MSKQKRLDPASVVPISQGRFGLPRIQVPVVESHLQLVPDVWDKNFAVSRPLFKKPVLLVPAEKKNGEHHFHVRLTSSQLRELAKLLDKAKQKPDLPQWAECLDVMKSKDGKWGLWYNGNTAFFFRSIAPRTLIALADLLDKKVRPAFGLLGTSVVLKKLIEMPKHSLWQSH